MIAKEDKQSIDFSPTLKGRPGQNNDVHAQLIDTHVFDVEKVEARDGSEEVDADIQNNENTQNDNICHHTYMEILLNVSITNRDHVVELEPVFFT